MTSPKHTDIRIRDVGADEAQEIRRVMQESFEEYRDCLVPPTGALTETLDDVREAMTRGGAFLAYRGDRAVGTARYQIRKEYLYAERIGVLPDYRRRGISTAIMIEIEQRARELNLPEVRLCVRASLPSNLRFCESCGYRAIESAPHPGGFDFVITLSKKV